MTKPLKPLTKQQKIKHIEKNNKTLLVMTLPQDEIVVHRLTYLGASSSPTILLKGEGCFNPTWEFFMSFTGQLIREVSETIAGNFYRGTVLENEIAKVFEFGERINYEYDSKGRICKYEISNKNLAHRIKNKIHTCKLHNYEKTLLRNIDPDNTDCIIGATLDRLIIEDDMSNTILYPEDYPYLDKPRYAIGVCEIKSTNIDTFKAEDGTILPVINLKNLNNVHLQYLIQVQNQMWQSNADYADLIHSSLSNHIVHRIYRDPEFIKLAHSAYTEFWSDAMLARKIVSNIKLVEEVFRQENILDEKAKITGEARIVTYDAEELDILAGQLVTFNLDLDAYNRKYVYKEFLTDAQYKDYLSMSYTGKDLLDLSDYIEENKSTFTGEQLEEYQKREETIISLIGRKKELDYVKKEYELTCNDIKFNLGQFTSISGFVEERGKDGDIKIGKDVKSIFEKTKLVTYNPTANNKSRILKVK